MGGDICTKGKSQATTNLALQHIIIASGRIAAHLFTNICLQTYLLFIMSIRYCARDAYAPSLYILYMHSFIHIFIIIIIMIRYMTMLIADCRLQKYRYTRQLIAIHACMNNFSSLIMLITTCPIKIIENYDWNKFQGLLLLT